MIMDFPLIDLDMLNEDAVMAGQQRVEDNVPPILPPPVTPRPPTVANILNMTENLRYQASGGAYQAPYNQYSSPYSSSSPYTQASTSYTTPQPPQIVPVNFNSHPQTTIPTLQQPLSQFSQYQPESMKRDCEMTSFVPLHATHREAQNTANNDARDTEVQLVSSRTKKKSLAQTKKPSNRKEKKETKRAKTPIKIDDNSEAAEDSEEDSRNNNRRGKRNMKPQEKLFLIKQCVEHKMEYKPNNKGIFWQMMKDLLKEGTGYIFADPRKTVTRWVEARIEEVLDEELGSGNEELRGDFKAAVEDFTERVHEVAEDVQEQAKDKYLKAQEAYETGRLENSMVFAVDDEPIPGFDAPVSSTRGSTPSIALSGKGKRKRGDEDDFLRGVTQLAESNEKSAAIMAEAIRVQRPHDMEVSGLRNEVDSLKSDIKDIKGSMEKMMTLLGNFVNSRESS